MLQALRQWLLLVLVAVLPFHALLVTVLTRMIAGSNHAPLLSVALWKEVLLAVICGIAVLEVITACRNRFLRFDLIDLLLALWMGLGIAVSTIDLGQFLYGVKYDFLAPIAFLILRRVPWSEHFLQRILKTLFVGGIILVCYGLIALVLPQSFFTSIGYSPLHSLYIPTDSLAAFQQIGGSMLRRMQSAMSGPNQLGIYLLLPLVTSIVFARVQGWTRRKRVLTIGLILFSILLTFSRSAWIAAAVVCAVEVFPPLWRRSRRIFLWSIGVVVFAVVVFVSVAPSTVLRSESSGGHFERSFFALTWMVRNPLGAGLGLVGPASNRTTDSCVELPPNGDSTWAMSHPELCVLRQVFIRPAERASLSEVLVDYWETAVGNPTVAWNDRLHRSTVQIQPGPDHVLCTCPFATENWFLQIGIETGLLGLLLYLAAIVVILRRYWQRSRSGDPSAVSARIAFLALLGVCIAGMFLHSFEDSAVAMGVWVIAAVMSRGSRVTRDEG